MFVLFAGGRSFSSDVKLASSSGVLTPEAENLVLPRTQKKGAPKIGAPNPAKILRGLRLFLALQRIQRQRQTRLVPVRRILGQRVLANSLVHLGKRRGS
jgi:hypothetical protein